MTVGILAVAFLFALGVIGPTRATPTPQQQAAAATETASPTATVTSSPTPTPEVGTSNLYVEYIIDASGSMTETLADGSVKLAVAKDLLKEHIAAFKPETNIGLRAYGHRVPYHQEAESCQDIELVAAPKAGQLETIAKWLSNFQAFGMTPLASSLQQAVSDLVFDPARINSVVVLSDGIETCGGDPCRLVESLRARGINFTVHVIGLNVDGQARDQLSCVAKSGGGTYQDATTAPDVERALGAIRSTVTKDEVIVPHGVSTPTPAPPLATAIPGFKTYTDSEIGFAIDYPGGWYEERIPGLVTFRSFPTTSRPNSELGAEGEVEIQIARSDAKGKSLGEVKQEQASEWLNMGEPSPIIWEDLFVLSDGVEASIAYLTGFNGQPVIHLQTVIDNQVIRVSGYGDLDPLDMVLQILRSFRLTGATRVTQTERAIASEPSSPLRGRLVFLSARGPHARETRPTRVDLSLYSISLNGGDERLEGRSLQFPSSTLAMAPDGSRVLLVSWRTKMLTLDSLTLTDWGAGSVACASWSPDGSLLAVCDSSADPHQLHLVKPDGGRVARITQDTRNYVAADWSPDGRRLAASSYENDQSGGLYVLNSDGSGLVQLVSGPTNDAAWSPSGNQIAFTRTVSEPGKLLSRSDIWIINVDGTGARNLTSGLQWSSGRAAWSPDGQSVAFGANGYLWRIDLAGGAAAQITTEGYSESPVLVQ